MYKSYLEFNSSASIAPIFLVLFFCYESAADPLLGPVVRYIWEGSEKCDDHGFKQLAASLPVERLSDDNEGDPWRFMYGNCAARVGKLRIQQDWVISYLDARPQEGYEGGVGYGVGTDLNFVWQSSISATADYFVDLGGGYQYAFDVPFPSNGSRSMFTINFGGGVIFGPEQGLRYRFGVRYMHVSNAALFPKNSGYDGIHIVLGTQW